MDFPPDLRGLAISNSDQIRNTHNSFSRQDPFIHEKNDDDDKDSDAYHFIAYVPKNGKVYELDGLKQGPVELGVTEDWLSVAAPAIEERINRYASSEIRFNLLAIVRNRSHNAYLLVLYDRCVRRKEAAEEALAGHLASVEAARGEGEGVHTALAEAERCRQIIHDEEVKFANWKSENQRRRHNYIPFAMTLLRQLAEKGHLRDLMEKGKKRRDASIAASLKAKQQKTGGTEESS
ncbi:unnamed protein product [Chrysoparadoxa australica]